MVKVAKLLVLFTTWLLIKIGQPFWWVINKFLILLYFKRPLQKNSEKIRGQKIRKSDNPIFRNSGFLSQSASFRIATKRRSNKSPLWKRLILNPYFIGPTIALVVVGLFFYSYFLIAISANLPTPQKLTQIQQPLTTEIYDRNGQLLYRLYNDRNRTLTKLDNLSANTINATIAIEDKNFWTHQGVDIWGVLRALQVNLNNQGQILQGGSTITQQLVKNNLLNSDRTLSRKITEAVLAFWTEKVYSKDQILEMYFNSVPYGGPSWGIEAAAETYFGKSAHDLSLAESAFLAGLPASPTTYSPFGDHPEYGRVRQKEVLDRMVEEKYITPSQADEAYNQQLSFVKPGEKINAPHFVMYIRHLLAEEYGDKYVAEAGLKVYTSLDLNLQQMAENVVSEEVAKLKPLNVSNGAAMISDPKTGQILAMVGSVDYNNPQFGNFNVTLSDRQPGSAIKVVTYATAFKQGLSPGSVIVDAPTNFPSISGNYAPVNYDGRFHGPVTIRTALGSSYNIPAVKTLNFVGIPNFLKTAHDMGITSLNDPDRYGLSLTLGGAEVKMIDMMTVYGTLADNGVKHLADPILKVINSDGQVLEDNTDTQGTPVLSPEIAYMITNILTDNNARTPAFGPNSLLNIPGHTIAVKTGTTDSKRDNYAFGYTPNYVVGAWVGNNDNSPMDPRLSSGITGATPIWSKIMSSLVGSQPDVAFARPSGVADGFVDGHRDLVISGQPIQSMNPLSQLHSPDSLARNFRNP